MSTRTETVAVLLGSIALALAFTYPLAFRFADHIAADAGDPVLTAWTLAWDADRIRHGLRGIWDAPNFFPYAHTLLYSDHLLGIALFTAPLQWMTRNPVLVYDAAFVASFAMAGVGMYVLARDLTGRRDAALIAAVIFACQPFRASHLSHLQWLMTGWLPLSLWAIHRYGRTHAARYAFAAAAFYLLQSLTASYFAYYALVPILIVGGAELFRARPPIGRLALHAGAVVLLVGVVMVPIARAYYEVRAVQGLKRSAEDIVGQSADVADYFSASPRLRFWGGLGAGRGEHELFPGAIVLVLSAAALVVHRRRTLVLVYAGVAATAFVLSLGPSPSAWGHSSSVPGPYAVLLRAVPGLDGLRAPARLAVVVQVALAAMAAFGAAWAIDRIPARARVATLVLLAAAIAAEGWIAPIASTPFPAFGPEERDAYAYVRPLPSGGVMELPTSAEDVDREFAYQYATLLHGHRAVNGHSGYVSPLAAWLGGGHSPFREADRAHDALAMLRGIGVRYLIVHRTSYADPPLADAMLAAIDRRSEDHASGDRSESNGVIERRDFGETTVVVLAPLEIPPAPAGLSDVPYSAVRLAASAGHDRLPLLFDGNVDTRWLTGRRQSGDEWLELHFDRPRDVRLIRLQLGARSFGDYPRDLAVDAIEDGRTRGLFRGPVLPMLARGILSDGAYPFIDVVLPENRASVLRLRQLGMTNTFFWSIHELRLRERL